MDYGGLSTVKTNTKNVRGVRFGTLGVMCYLSGRSGLLSAWRRTLHSSDVDIEKRWGILL